MSMVDSTNGSLKALAKPKHSSQLKEFLALGKKIFQDKEVSDYDQLLDCKKELERKLLLKNQEVDEKVEELSVLRSANTKEIELLQSSMEKKISELESTNKTLFDEFQRRYKSWDARTTRRTDLENEVVNLQQELTGAEENVESSNATIKGLQDKLFEYQNTLEDTKNTLRAIKKNLSSKDRELTGTVRELESTQAELKAQRSELGFEDPSEEYLATKFRALAAQCHQIAKTFFCTQLPPELISNDFWKELENSGFITAVPKKTPLSNSISAQCLRMATAERIIADKLCNFIFRKYYLPESSPARAVLNDVLARLDKGNSRKEAIFGLQLLDAYELDEQGHISSLVESTIGDITGPLSPLLFAPGARKGFQSVLRKFLTEAIALWRSVQRSATKVSVLNDPEYTGFDSVQTQGWDMNEEYDNAVELAADQIVHIPDQSEPLISLFPQLSIGRNVICSGCALWSDQNTVVAASIEFSQLNSRSSAQGRGALGRRDSDRRKLSF